MYDYVLVVGPGRSGSEFLYLIMKNHPDFAFPTIKEGAYYRSPRAFQRAYQRLSGEPRQVLCDIANTAYRDRALFRGVEMLRASGFKILLMVLMRDHRDRAISMMRFRKSRGEPTALWGSRRLEQAAVRDRLVPETLFDIFRIDVDILTVYFTALTQDTAAVLDILATLCEVSKFTWVPQGAVNESVNPRFVWLSALGWLCGQALRKLGFRYLLQHIKDSQRVKRMFFVPLPHDRDDRRLFPESVQTLDTSYRACRSIVENASERLREGIYFRKAGSTGQLP